MLERLRTKVADWIEPKGFELDPLGSELAMATGLSGFSRTKRSERQLLAAFNRNPTLHGVVHKIAESFATITWTVSVQRDANGRATRSRKLKRLRNPEARRKLIRSLHANGELEELDNHPLLDLFEFGNEVLDGHSVFQLMQEYLDLSGNSYIALTKNDFGLPTAMWPMPPTWINQTPTPTRPWFEVVVNGSPIKMDPADVIWLKDPDPVNPYGRGTGPSGSLANELDTDEYAAQFIQSFFANGAMPDAIVGFPGAKIENVKTVEQDWNDGHRGPRKAHRIRFVNKEVKVVKLGAEFKDRDIVGLRRFLRDEVLHQFGMPPEIMGIIENSKRATIGAAETIFARWVLVPRAERVRIGLQKQLVDPIDPNLILGYDSPVPEDREHTLDVMKSARHNFSRTQWQVAAGNDFDDEDDAFLIPDSLVVVPVDGSEPMPLKAQTEPVSRAKRARPLPAGVKAPPITPADIDFVLADLIPARLTDATIGVMEGELEAWGSAALADLGVDISFNMVNPLVVTHLEQFEVSMGIANATTERQLRTALTEGIFAGEGVVELSKRVAEVFDEARGNRSDLIAWTEVNRSSNFGNFQAMSTSGVVEQRDWVNAGDTRVRNSHRIEQTRGMNQPFTLATAGGGISTGMHPGAMDDPAENFRCRCTTVANFDLSAAVHDMLEKAGGDYNKALQIVLRNIVDQTEERREPWRDDLRTAAAKGFARQEKDILAALNNIQP